MVRRIYINGRFLSQRLTGVQRYGTEVLLALDTILDEMGTSSDIEYLVLAPRDTPPLALRNIGFAQVGPLEGHAWEQLTLPWAARDGLLWSFGPMGPLAVADQAITVHDAAVRAVPSAFSHRFRIWYEIVLPILLARVEQVMTVSEFSRAELVKHYGVSTTAMKVSGEGWQHVARLQSDRTILKEHSLEPGRYVLAVSSVTPHKNFSVVAKALSLLERADPVVIAGVTNDRYFAAVSSESLRNVKRVGYVSDEQLRALYADAGVFVYPSFYEGFGLPPLEAMALGCPVIAARAGSLPETCGDGAWYFDPNDARELAALIERVMTDDEARAELIARGFARLEHHSWDRAARAHLSAMRAALRRHPVFSAQRVAQSTRFKRTWTPN